VAEARCHKAKRASMPLALGTVPSISKCREHSRHQDTLTGAWWLNKKQNIWKKLFSRSSVQAQFAMANQALHDVGMEDSDFKKFGFFA
jgi:hypothetical protein